MTRSERLERRLPELFDELAAPRVPDYYDDLLRQTARTRQRPAWSSLERWIPMSEIARPAPLGLPSWRPILMAFAFVLLLLIALGAALLVGAGRPRLPAFGPAHNGSIFLSDANGAILSVDPASGASHTVIAGSSSTYDWAPYVTADGQHLVFNRGMGSAATIWIASIDGSSARAIPGPVSGNAPTDISPNGRLVSVTASGGLLVADLDSLTTATVSLPFKVLGAAWRSTSGELVVTHADGTKTAYSLVNADGTNLRPLFSADDVVDPQPAVSPDGATLAYFTWSPTARDQQGVVHVANLDTGQQRVIADGTKDGSNWEGPQFSPDGSQILVEHSVPGGVYRLALLNTDGSGTPRELGAPRPVLTDGAASQFSPDGTKVLATYRSDSTTWLYDLASGKGTQVTWAPTEFLSWQRVP